jgi:hypothetical protein
MIGLIIAIFWVALGLIFNYKLIEDDEENVEKNSTSFTLVCIILAPVIFLVAIIEQVFVKKWD